MPAAKAAARAGVRCNRRNSALAPGTRNLRTSLSPWRDAALAAPARRSDRRGEAAPGGEVARRNYRPSL